MRQQLFGKTTAAFCKPRLPTQLLLHATLMCCSESRAARWHERLYPVNVCSKAQSDIRPELPSGFWISMKSVGQSAWNKMASKRKLNALTTCLAKTCPCGRDIQRPKQVSKS